ncbi:hypothetical protein [Bosea sp. BIWAKO-01]|uniref:hypothetical protein n=1 Tax=Bosea sp. BIWAKO-01 TaxID=506668 RepID=UPI00086AD70C|nr:hypothetical protein [Bosea sp. BIWAKO-01]GAU84767.1 hypothetical protein BIWAKO_04704 [Bosea sp. BIWAKO-01]
MTYLPLLMAERDIDEHVHFWEPELPELTPFRTLAMSVIGHPNGISDKASEPADY